MGCTRVRFYTSIVMKMFSRVILCFFINFGVSLLYAEVIDIYPVIKTKPGKLMKDHELYRFQSDIMYLYSMYIDYMNNGVRNLYVDSVSQWCKKKDECLYVYGNLRLPPLSDDFHNALFSFGMHINTSDINNLALLYELDNKDYFSEYFLLMLEWCTYEENRATHAHAVIERKALELIAALCKKHAILFNLDNHISELEIDERVFTENKRYLIDVLNNVSDKKSYLQSIEDNNTRIVFGVYIHLYRAFLIALSSGYGNSYPQIRLNVNHARSYAVQSPYAEKLLNLIEDANAMLSNFDYLNNIISQLDIKVLPKPKEIGLGFKKHKDARLPSFYFFFGPRRMYTYPYTSDEQY